MGPEPSNAGLRPNQKIGIDRPGVGVRPIESDPTPGKTPVLSTQVELLNCDKPLDSAFHERTFYPVSFQIPQTEYLIDMGQGNSHWIPQCSYTSEQDCLWTSRFFHKCWRWEHLSSLCPGRS